uniref:G-protein coupled receptors family 1 profile domain-containing protein n=1 Tax=Macaca fascicularis TaxID=9541 RepID=A0A7N9CR41_MACFA
MQPPPHAAQCWTCRRPWGTLLTKPGILVLTTHSSSRIEALPAPDMSPCGPLNLSLAGEATTCAAPWVPNASVVPPSGASPALPIFSMTLGAVSNLLALALLAQAAGRLRRRRSAATFLLFVASLLATDLAPGALVLRLYTAGRAPAGGACHFLGGCMVFFGLCPLLLGCGMAVERCVGVTRPLLHAARVSVLRALALAAAGARCAAAATSCSTRARGASSAWVPRAAGARHCSPASSPASACSPPAALATSAAAPAGLPGLGPRQPASLGARGPCSASASSASSIASASTAFGGSQSRGSARRARSHDVEMVGQLVGIMVVSCICPMLVRRGPFPGPTPWFHLPLLLPFPSSFLPSFFLFLPFPSTPLFLFPSSPEPHPRFFASLLFFRIPFPPGSPFTLPATARSSSQAFTFQPRPHHPCACARQTAHTGFPRRCWWRWLSGAGVLPPCSGHCSWPCALPPGTRSWTLGCTSCCARPCCANCFASCPRGLGPRAAPRAGPNPERLGGQLAAQLPAQRPQLLLSTTGGPTTKPTHPGAGPRCAAKSL